jgi:hypothetical protein
MNYPEGFSRAELSRKPICGVLSVALCANVSYPVAHAACKRAMNALGVGLRFRGRTYQVQREHALASLAVRFEKETLGLGETLGHWVAKYAVPGVAYMVCVRGHVVTVRDGIIVDQNANLPAIMHPSRRKFVTRITRITGKGW